MTLKLWADQEGDGERSCCSPQAVLGARALAHSMGFPHLTLDLRGPLPRTPSSSDFLAEHDARPHAEPVRALQRPRALRRDAGAGGAHRRRRARHRPLRADRATTGRGRCWRAPRTPRKDQTYMLAGLRPAAARPRPLPARRADQARGARARARGAAAGGREAREPGPLLPRGHDPRALPRASRRPAATARATSSTARGRVLGRHAATGASRSGSARGLGVAAGEPLYVLVHRRGRQPGRRRPARRPRDRARVAAVARDALPRRRARGPREAALPLRARRLPRDRDAGQERRGGRRSRSDVHGVAPGQTACLMDGDRVVGHGTIAAAS